MHARVFLSGTCGVDWHSPRHQHPLMFVVRVFIQGQGVDAAPLYTHCPARGHSHKFWGRTLATCKFNLVLVYVMLTCSRSCGSSCGNLSYEDCLVHADEPVVLEGRLQSDTAHEVFMHPPVIVIHSCSHPVVIVLLIRQNGCASDWTQHMNWATEMAPSAGQTELRGDAIVHPIPKYQHLRHSKSVSYFKSLLKTHFNLKAFSWFILIHVWFIL